MKGKQQLITLWFIYLCFSPLPLQAKPTEIIFWHSLAGHLGEQIQLIANGFNKSQTEYRIKPIYKGNYIESLTSFAAAFRAHQPPSMVQVFEVGKDSMLIPQGIIKPVHELMEEEGMTLPLSSFFPAIRAYYSEHNKLMAMPLNTSIPVMVYDVMALASVGYSGDSFPSTWDELEVLANKLRQRGFRCAYTSTYPAWILIESFAALHGLTMTDASHQKATYNSQAIITHLARLRRWQREHYFEHGGRSDDATVLFTSGRCPLISQSSGAFNSVKQLVTFPVAMAPIPLDKEVSVTRFNNVTGGAAIWVVNGQNPLVYRGIARFFVYLARPDVQQQWHQNTGYLPLGMSGEYHELAHLSQHPSLLLAQHELASKEHPTHITQIAAQNQIRIINDEALEMIFAGIKSPRLAMNDAVTRADHAISRFRKNTSSHGQ